MFIKALRFLHLAGIETSGPPGLSCTLSLFTLNRLKATLSYDLGHVKRVKCVGHFTILKQLLWPEAVHVGGIYAQELHGWRKHMSMVGGTSCSGMVILNTIHWQTSVFHFWDIIIFVIFFKVTWTGQHMVAFIKAYVTATMCCTNHHQQFWIDGQTLLWAKHMLQSVYMKNSEIFYTKWN